MVRGIYKQECDIYFFFGQSRNAISSNKVLQKIIVFRFLFFLLLSLVVFWTWALSQAIEMLKWIPRCWCRGLMGNGL